MMKERKFDFNELEHWIPDCVRRMLVLQKKFCLIYEESGISFIDLNYYTAKGGTLVIPSLIVLSIFEISPLKDIWEGLKKWT